MCDDSPKYYKIFVTKVTIRSTQCVVFVQATDSQTAIARAKARSIAIKDTDMIASHTHDKMEYEDITEETQDDLDIVSER